LKERLKKISNYNIQATPSRCIRNTTSQETKGKGKQRKKENKKDREKVGKISKQGGEGNNKKQVYRAAGLLLWAHSETDGLAFLVRQFDHRYTQMSLPTWSDLQFNLITFVGLLRVKLFSFIFLSFFYRATMC